MAKGSREAYELAVRELARVAEDLSEQGKGEEEIAREVVRLRNELKALFRSQDPPELVALMERRNIAKYGNSLGPDANDLYLKYGSWPLVIAAACRPLNLSKGL